MSASETTPKQASQTEPQTKTDTKQPVRYSRDLANYILRQIASGRSLRTICAEPEMPDESTVRQWSLDDLDGFAPHYARACELRQMALVEEIQDLAEEQPRMMRVEISNGAKSRVEERIDPGFEKWRETRINTRKWVASKILPKLYGDRVGVDLAVTVDPNSMSNEMLAQIAAKAIGRMTIDGTAQEAPEAAELLAIECTECAQE